MGLFQILSGIKRQVNPFDNGATYSNPYPKVAARPAPQQPQQPQQGPNLFQRVLAQVNPLDNGRTWQNPNPQNNRSVVGQLTHNGATNLAGDLTVKPIAATAAGFIIDPARSAVAQLTHNQPAFNAAEQHKAQDINNSIPGFFANNLFHGTAAAADLGFRAPIEDIIGHHQAANQIRTAGLQHFNQTAPGQAVSPAEYAITNAVHAPNSSQEQIGLNPRATGAQKYISTPVSGAVGTAGFVEGVSNPAGAVDKALAGTKSAAEAAGNFAKGQVQSAKELAVGNPRPFRNISDAEVQAVQRVRAQQSGWGNTIREGDTQAYSRVANKLGTKPGDVKTIDNMLGSIKTYESRKATLQGGYVGRGEAGLPNEQVPASPGDQQIPATPSGNKQLRARDVIDSLPSNSPTKSPKVNARGFTTSVKNSAEVSAATRGKVKGGYVPTTNESLVGNSQSLLSGGLDKATNKVLTDLGQTAGRVTPQTVSDAIAVAKAHDEAGNFDQASHIYDRLASHGTVAGQKVQALSLLSNRTPQGLFYSAIKTLKKAGVDGTTGDLGARLQSAVDSIKQTSENSPERQLATQHLVKLVNQNLPRSKAQAAVGLWRAGLLTGPETLAKVGVSHAITAPIELASRPVSALVDRLTSLATGQRGFTTGAGDLASYGSGVKRGAAAIGTKLRTGLDAPHTGGFDETFGSNAHQTPYEEAVGRAHGSLMKPNYSGAYDMSLTSQARTAAINQGLKGADRSAFIDKFVNSPSKDAIATATKEAENFTNMQRTAGGELASKLQSFAPGGVPVGKLIVPFTRIPTAIASKGIVDWTPLGLTKAAAQVINGIRHGNFDQRAFSQVVGRSLTGTLTTTAVGYELMKSGNMTLKAPADPKERALWAAEGKQANSIKIGGKWISLNALGPAGISIGLGGAFQSAVANGSSPGNAVAQAATAAGGLVADQPYFKGISGVANALKDPARSGGTFIENTVGSLIPAGVSQTARGSDPLQRAYPAGVVDKLKSEIPGQRESLPPQRDVYGATLPGSGGSLPKDIIGTLNPFYPSQPRNVGDPVTTELQRLYDTQGSGGSPTIGPPNKTPTVQGVKVRMTPQQLDTFIKQSGPKIREGLNNLVNNPQYQALDDAHRVLQINKIISAARSAQTLSMTNDLTTNGKVLSGIPRPSKPSKAVLLAMNHPDQLGKTVTTTSSTGSSAATNPQDRYKTAVTNFNAKKSSMTQPAQVRAQANLARLKVSSGFSQDIVDLYGLTKSQIANYLISHPNGDQLKQQLTTYDNQLYNSGVISRQKFATGFTVARKSSGGSTRKRAAFKAPASGGFKPTVASATVQRLLGKNTIKAKLPTLKLAHTAKTPPSIKAPRVSRKTTRQIA